MMELDDFFSTEFVYEAKVLIDPVRIVIENTPHGNRRIIRITGGSFKGPRIQGIVLPGGADWQLLRADGVNELDARYAMQTHDGVPIHVRNRVLSRSEPESTDPFSPGFYRRSVLSFEAPLECAYSWLNKSVFLGTLTPATTEHEVAVILRAWKLL
ncbi:MAG: DUF3237 domain-containing protein [Spirochaetaceae bacterium]|nr:DUF3237 domain-containing protein [Spirochaetaceae bacterium]